MSGCVGACALLLVSGHILPVLHLAGNEKPLGLCGEQILKAHGVGLPPPVAVLLRTRRRGKYLLGAPSKDGDIHPGAKNVFDSFIGKSPAGSCREGTPVPVGMLCPSSGAGGREQQWLEVCWGHGGSLQTGARVPRTLLCPLQAVPSQDLFNSHLLKHCL